MASIIEIKNNLLHYPSTILSVIDATILDVWPDTILQNQEKSFGRKIKKTHQQKNVDSLCVLKRIKVNDTLIVESLDT